MSDLKMRGENKPFATPREVRFLERQIAELQAQVEKADRVIMQNRTDAINSVNRIEQLQSQVESDQMMLDIRDTQLRIAKEKLDKVRGEYLNHVKATKSPVMVLDAIGWILTPLEQKL